MDTEDPFLPALLSNYLPDASDASWGHIHHQGFPHAASTTSPRTCSPAALDPLTADVSFPSSPGSPHSHHSDHHMLAHVSKLGQHGASAGPAVVGLHDAPELDGLLTFIRDIDNGKPEALAEVLSSAASMTSSNPASPPPPGSLLPSPPSPAMSHGSSIGSSRRSSAASIPGAARFAYSTAAPAHVGPPVPPATSACSPPTKGQAKAPRRKGEKKKTAHNLIERKYRNSINDRLNELKALLPGSESGKMHKAAILRRAIEFIGQLTKRATNLEAENAALKRHLAALDGTNPNGKRAAPFAPLPRAPSSNPASPSLSDFDAPSPSSSLTSSSSGSDPCSPPQPMHLPSKRARTDARPAHATGTTRLMVCMLLFGVCFFGPEVGSSTLSDVGRSGARVLSSVKMDNAFLSSWLSSSLVYWVTRSVLFLAMAALLFIRDPASDAESALARAALEHEKKCTLALSQNDRAAARQHALDALECIGRPWPSSSSDLWLSFAWQVVRQAAHLLWVGEWLDRVLAARDASAQTSVGVGALALHRLHQLMMQDTPCKDDALEPVRRSLAAMRAVNMAEAAPASLDPYYLARIYVGAAIQVKLALNSPLATVYLGKARQSYRACSDRAGDLAWLFQSEGQQFFRRGAWARQTVVGAEGEKMLPGTVEHLGVAFRLDLMGKTSTGFITGGDTEIIEQRLHDLRQYSVQAQDAHREWWALMGLVAVNWRMGKKLEARTLFVGADRLGLHKTRLQEAVYAAFRAHQALLDGDHGLCWSACERASALLQEDPAAPCTDFAHLAHSARNIGFRHLLSTRIALYRLRSYLSQTSGAARLQTVETADGSPVSFPVMLSRAQEDVSTLRVFQDAYPLVEPQIYLYQAICRCLAGGRLAPTEHLFHQSVKAARRLGLPYDEALALWHTSAFLRPSLTPKSLRQNLQCCLEVFQRLQAADELTSTRKMLQLVDSA